jgi:DNA modification methylase
MSSPTLLHGDCLDILPGFEPGSIDAFVDDPPAGIAMMGKSWDDLRGYKPRTERGREVLAGLGLLGLEPWAAGFVAFMFEVSAAKLRVAKPGAHSLSWALPRTSDLTMMAMRLAGWEIRDTITHLFACLTDDAQILTEHGWTHCRNIATSDLALCYSVDDGAYQWQRIEQRVDFPYTGDAYRVRGDGVDHTVTPDHRCVDGERFITAEQAAREPAIRVPVPQGLHGLRLHVDGSGPLPGAEGQGVRASVCWQGDNGEAQGDSHGPAGALSDLRSTLLAQEPNPDPAALLAPLLRYLAEHGCRHAGSHADDLAGWSSRSDAGVDRPCGGQDAGAEQPGMEGRRGPAQSCRAQAAGGNGPLSARTSVDGASERLRVAAPACGGAGNWPGADQVGGGAPRGPQPDQQSPDEPDAVRDERGSQTVRGTRLAAATVERVRYAGRMWCVTVPTGAFVARTSAGVFVTGNSGFPKSLDVSKAIDREAGAVREDLGARTDGRYAHPMPVSGRSAGIMGEVVEREAPRITAPATDAARKWDGWHTTLSPAAEYWILARAPMSETVARNVLAHGTGALNIGATRTPTDGRAARRHDGARSLDNDVQFSAGRGGLADGETRLGRWPKNAVLSCALACDGNRHSPGCPRRMLDEMSGHLGSGHNPRQPKALHTFGQAEDRRADVGANNGHDDSGGASRFFPTFGYYPKASDRTIPGRSDITNTHPTIKSPDLMRWLVRLVTPPSGRLLDCFMGSGTTGVACAAEGVAFTGIEADAGNFEIARARVLAAHGSPEYAAEANTTAPTGAQMVLL